jgi:hypothetical protein
LLYRLATDTAKVFLSVIFMEITDRYKIDTNRYSNRRVVQ